MYVCVCVSVSTLKFFSNDDTFILITIFVLSTDSNVSLRRSMAILIKMTMTMTMTATTTHLIRSGYPAGTADATTSASVSQPSFTTRILIVRKQPPPVTVQVQIISVYNVNIQQQTLNTIIIKKETKIIMEKNGRHAGMI